MRYWREISNLTAFLSIFAGLFAVFFVLRDVRLGMAPDWGLAIFSAICFIPYGALLATGRLLAASFFTELVYGGSRAAALGYSKERSWAREGRGRDAALGFLWRHRIIGDVPGLWAVLEMARFDPNMKDLAVSAASHLFRSGLSQADRDHVGRQLQLVQVSEAREAYTGWR